MSERENRCIKPHDIISPEKILKRIAEFGHSINRPLGLPIFIINDHEGLKLWMASEGTSLLKRDQPYILGRETAEGVFTMIGGEEHQARQKVVGRPVASHVEQYAPQVGTITQSWMSKLAGTNDHFEITNPAWEFKLILLHSICSTLFGYKLPPIELMKVAESFHSINQYLQRNIKTLFLLDKAGNKIPQLKEKYTNALQHIREFADMLLQIETGPFQSHISGRLTHDEARDEVITVLTASHATTAGAIAFTLQLLSQKEHVHYQEKIREELNTKGESETLQHAIKETLRLYPAFHTTTRTAVEDIPWGNSVIRAGTTVVLSPYILHRNPTLWPGADTDMNAFRPERFKKGVEVYYPFGAGARACNGRNMALMMIEAILGTMIKDWQFTTESPIRPVFGSTLRPHPDTVIAADRIRMP